MLREGSVHLINESTVSTVARFSYWRLFGFIESEESEHTGVINSKINHTCNHGKIEQKEFLILIAAQGLWQRGRQWSDASMADSFWKFPLLLAARSPSSSGLGTAVVWISYAPRESVKWGQRRTRIYLLGDHRQSVINSWLESRFEAKANPSETHLRIVRLRDALVNVGHLLNLIGWEGAIED